METGSKHTDKIRALGCLERVPEHDTQTSEGFCFCWFGEERRSGKTMVQPRQQGKRTRRVKEQVIQLQLMPKPESKGKTAKYKADEVKTLGLKQIKTKNNLCTGSKPKTLKGYKQQKIIDFNLLSAEGYRTK